MGPGCCSSMPSFAVSVLNGTNGTDVGKLTISLQELTARYHAISRLKHRHLAAYTGVIKAKDGMLLFSRHVKDVRTSVHLLPT